MFFFFSSLHAKQNEKHEIYIKKKIIAAILGCNEEKKNIVIAVRRRIRFKCARKYHAHIYIVIFLFYFRLRLKVLRRCIDE